MYVSSQPSKTELIKAFSTKLCTSLQFAACMVSVLIMIFPDNMETHSCEAEGSFWKDDGLMTYFFSFMFYFFAKSTIAYHLYNEHGKPKICPSILADMRECIRVEAVATDSINTCSSIYFWTIPNVSPKQANSIKIILYVLTLLAPVLDSVFYLGKKTRFKEKIEAAIQNRSFEKYFIKPAEASYAAMNIASTVVMIIQFLINVAYDSVHEDDYPYSPIIIAFIATFAAVIGFTVSLSSLPSANNVLTKLQSAADTFYYPTANMLSMAECEFPKAFSIDGYKKTGYGLNIAMASVSFVLALMDYFTHVIPTSRMQIELIIRQQPASATISERLKARLTNLFCLTYLPKEEIEYIRLDEATPINING